MTGVAIFCGSSSGLTSSYSSTAHFLGTTLVRQGIIAEFYDPMIALLAGLERYVGPAGPALLRQADLAPGA